MTTHIVIEIINGKFIKLDQLKLKQRWEDTFMVPFSLIIKFLLHLPLSSFHLRRVPNVVIFSQQ